MARSAITFPGSCRANGLRHRARALDNAVSSPAARNVSTSETAPACDTTPTPDASGRTRGYSPILFTMKALTAQRISVTRHH